MKVVDSVGIGRRALAWIGRYTDQSCSEEDLALALAGTFLAGMMCGETKLARQVATRVPAAGEVPLETKAVLARLGLARPLSLPGPPAVPTVLDILTSAPDELPALVGAVEQASRFGRYPLPDLTGLAAALTGTGLGCLASYDLELGGRLLRAANYAGSGESLGQRWGVELLARQQRSDGAFGFIATSLMEGVDPSDPRVVSAYSLPVTVACLWTLAELTVPGFRLLDIPTAMS